MRRHVSVTLGDEVRIVIGPWTVLLTLEEARDLAWQLLAFKSFRDDALTALADGAAADIAERLHALAREFEPKKENPNG